MNEIMKYIILMQVRRDTNYFTFAFNDRLNSSITAALSFLIFLPSSFRGQFAYTLHPNPLSQ